MHSSNCKVHQLSNTSLIGGHLEVIPKGMTARALNYWTEKVNLYDFIVWLYHHHSIVVTFYSCEKWRCSNRYAWHMRRGTATACTVGIGARQCECQTFSQAKYMLLAFVTLQSARWHLLSFPGYTVSFLVYIHWDFCSIYCLSNRLFLIALAVNYLDGMSTDTALWLVDWMYIFVRFLLFNHLAS